MPSTTCNAHEARARAHAHTRRLHGGDTATGCMRAITCRSERPTGSGNPFGYSAVRPRRDAAPADGGPSAGTHVQIEDVRAEQAQARRPQVPCRSSPVSPGADVTGVSPVPVLTWRGVRPVPVQTRRGVSPVPAKARHRPPRDRRRPDLRRETRTASSQKPSACTAKKLTSAPS